MAECAILHAGSESVTEKMNVFLGEWIHLENSVEVPSYHCMPGYCNGGEYAHYYWPLGALPVLFERSYVGTSTEEYTGDNNNRYRRTTATYHLKIISWQGDTLSLWRIRPVPMSSALSEEPSPPSGVARILYFPMIDDILNAVESDNGHLINNLLDQYGVSQSTASGLTTFTVPCLAALRVDIETGDSFPAFVGASAIAVAISSHESWDLTRDNVVYDGTFAAVTTTLISSGTPFYEEDF